jgi:hypothetical protein
MDFNDGEILCKTSVPYDEELPPAELLDKMFSLNLWNMDRHLPAIMQVIYAGVTPRFGKGRGERPLVGIWSLWQLAGKSGMSN